MDASAKSPAWTSRVARRLIDGLVSLLALLILSPVIALIYVVVWRSMGQPVFFSQMRAGRGGKPFAMYKFRTMNEARDAQGELLSDVERTTQLGSFLRASSLDELPELLNVLLGQMSLVGPRPLPVGYTEKYNTVQRRRLEVKPGITGWAQVNGRNQTTWDERFAHDLYYVENQSLWLDLKIIALTFRVVLRGADVNASERETMKKFEGSGQ
jgi:sugar transferase EpsL